MRVTKLPYKIGIAVSGGVDSMSLLWLCREAEQDMLVINIEHGIRGKTSVEDSIFVEKFCNEHNIPFVGFTVDAVTEAKKTGESLETCARRLRYEIFDNLLKEGRVAAIALAHHADDNAETVLMRIFRGTGIKGLCGIIDRDCYIHPLIKYSRKEIELYAKENSIPFVTDETNLQSEYTRNFIRNELLPLIKERYPDVLNSVGRLTENCIEADDYLLRASKDCISVTNKEIIIVGFFSEDIALHKYTLTKATQLFGVYQDIESRHLSELLKLKDKSNNTIIDLPFGIEAYRFNNDLRLRKKSDENSYNRPYLLNEKYKYKNNVFTFEKVDKSDDSFMFDGDKLPKSCVVRTRIDGDVFKNANGRTKLLSDFLNERKLTLTNKEELLLLAQGHTVYAVLGYAISDLVKYDNNTENYIKVNVEVADK